MAMFLSLLVNLTVNTYVEDLDVMMMMESFHEGQTDCNRGMVPLSKLDFEVAKVLDDNERFYFAIEGNEASLSWYQKCSLTSPPILSS